MTGWLFSSPPHPVWFSGPPCLLSNGNGSLFFFKNCWFWVISTSNKNTLRIIFYTIKYNVLYLKQGEWLCGEKRKYSFNITHRYATSLLSLWGGDFIALSYRITTDFCRDMSSKHQVWNPHWTETQSIWDYFYKIAPLTVHFVNIFG
jgi:hypothetical protein